MTFDTRNDKLVLRVRDKHAPIRVYNTDTWRLHDELGGDIDHVTDGLHHDVTVDTRRNLYVINVHQTPVNHRVIRMNTDGTCSDDCCPSWGHREVRSMAYNQDADVYVFCVGDDWFFVRKYFWSYYVDWPVHVPRGTVTVATDTFQGKPIIILCGKDYIKLYHMCGVHIKTYSSYVTLEGRDVIMGFPRPAYIDDKGKVFALDTANTCLVRFWKEGNVLRKEELNTQNLSLSTVARVNKMAVNREKKFLALLHDCDNGVCDITIYRDDNNSVSELGLMWRFVKQVRQWWPLPVVVILARPARGFLCWWWKNGR